MHSVQLRKTFTFWSSSPEIVEISRQKLLSVLPEREDLFNTFYLLKSPTTKSHKALNQGNLGAKDRA
jgi:hypothetical protein